MDLIESLNWRYATNKFDANKKLSISQIEKLKTAFALTPSSYGLQPTRMLIIEDYRIRKQLYEHAYNQPQVLDASHLLVLCAVRQIDDAYINGYFDKLKRDRRISGESMTQYQKNILEVFQGKTNQEILLWASKQVYITLGNLLTFCACEKIDSCPMEGFSNVAFDKILSLEDKKLSSVVLLPIGYRDKNDEYSYFKKVRFDLNRLVSHI